MWRRGLRDPAGRIYVTGWAGPCGLTRPPGNTPKTGWRGPGALSVGSLSVEGRSSGLVRPVSPLLLLADMSTIKVVLLRDWIVFPPLPYSTSAPKE